MLQSPVSRDPGRAWLWSLRAAAAGLLALLATGCGGPGARLPASGQSARVDLLRCEDLRGLAIAAGDIGLPTRGAIVRSVEREPELVPYADPDGEHLLPTAARCVVQGAIASVDPAASTRYPWTAPIR